MHMDFINIFHVIILSSLIGSLMVLILLMIKGIFRNILSSTFHYYIWIILLIKLIMPFGPQTPLNASNMHEKLFKQSTSKRETLVSFNPQFKNMKSNLSTIDSRNLHKGLISSTYSKSLKNKLNIENALCYAWMLGTVIFALKLLAGYKILRKIVIHSEKNINERHKEILHNCMNILDIRSNVKISYSGEIDSPSLCGLLKPRILIPVSAANNVSDEEFKCIIMHELCHLKNKDIFINWIISLSSIIYWFNPILLYGFHKIRQDCEFHCDNQVISYLAEGENIQYGNALIRVLELGIKNRGVIGTAPMIMNNSEIKRRIIMISRLKKVNKKSILLGCFIAAAAASIAILINVSSPVFNESTPKVSTHQAAKPALDVKDSAPDIVIYNSHADEAYPSRKNVTDVAALINERLIKEGLKSNFIKCNKPAEYIKSFSNSRSIITNSIKNYSSAILLDIHRDSSENNKEGTKKITFELAKNNPHYSTNKEFVDSIIKNMKDSNEVKMDVFLYANGICCFNQDLSNNSALVEIGNDMSSDSDIEECINALVSALRDTEKVSKN